MEIYNINLQIVMLIQPTLSLINQLPNHASIIDELQEDDWGVYVEHLKQIQEDIQFWFKDLLEMNIPVWKLLPFEVNVAVVVGICRVAVWWNSPKFCLKKYIIITGKIVTLHVNIYFYGRKQKCTLLRSQHHISLNMASVMCLAC